MSTGKIVLIVVGSILLILALSAGIWGFRYATAGVRGQIEAREEIQSADYRIYSYDHFYNLYANVQSYEDQIRNQRNLMETLEDEEEIARYRQNVNALMNQRASVVRQYNADVRKEGTRGQFLADDLPRQIGIDFE